MQRGGSWPAFKPVFKPVGKGLRGLCFWKWLGQKLVSNQFDFTELVSNQFVKMVWQRTSGIVLLKVICPKTVFKPVWKKTGSKTVLKLVSNQFLKPGWQRTSGIVLLKVIWQNWSKLVANQFNKPLGICFWASFQLIKSRAQLFNAAEVLRLYLSCNIQRSTWLELKVHTPADATMLQRCDEARFRWLLHHAPTRRPGEI